MVTVNQLDEVGRFIDRLEESTQAKFLRLVSALKQFGPVLGMPYTRQIAHNLYELRIRGQQEIRIFYTFHNNYAVLLHGFIKKSQKTPPREIQTALKCKKSLD